ncbi:MAG: hypothetical protein IJ141_04155 [Lachnospiraceae bacterium]|nr:hypothetical protein [Lachnospiraceae bacterium]
MEYYKKCSVCGKIWSYTTEDIMRNKSNATQGAISAIGAIASVFVGTRLDTYALNNNSNNSLDKVIDYDKCPNCGSLKSVSITSDELNNNKEVSSVFNGYSIEINKNASEESLLKRIELFLEDGEWEQANYYCEQVLDINPENGYAYFYKLMAEKHIKIEEDIQKCSEPLDSSPLYNKILRFADYDLKNKIYLYNEQIVERLTKEKEKEEEKIRNLNYKQAIILLQLGFERKNIDDIKKAYNKFVKLNDYENSKKYANDSLLKIKELEILFEKERAILIKKEIKEKEEKRRKKKRIAVGLICVLIIIMIAMVFF